MIAALRHWAAKYTERDRYSPVGIVFHWVMAALVLFQLGWGFYTGIIPPGGDKIFAYEVHSAVGLPILLLAILRLMWRAVIPGPVNDADRQGWKTTAAHWTHYLFYFCFFGLPLSGWAMWSALAEPGPLRLAGVVPWPQMPFETLPLEMRYAAMDIAEDIHHLLVILLLVLVPAHVGAALKHHFWDRHDVLRGMLPEIPDAEDPREARQHKPRAPRLPAE
ncbi:MAG: cytochrome b [Allosphingosinicella sp.]